LIPQGFNVKFNMLLREETYLYCVRSLYPPQTQISDSIFSPNFSSFISLIIHLTFILSKPYSVLSRRIMKLPRVFFGLLGLGPMAYTSFSGRLHSSERHDEPDRRSQPIPINLETRHEIETGNSSLSPAPNDAVLSALGGLEHYKAAAMAKIIVPLVAGARPSDGLQERLWELLKTLTEANGVDAFDKWESHYSEVGIAAYIGLIRVGAMIAANLGNSTILSEAMKDSTASPAIKVHQDSSTNPSKVLFQQYPTSTWPQDKWIGTTANNPLFDWGDLQWEALLELEERIYEQEKLLPGMLSEEQNLATQQLQVCQPRRLNQTPH